MECRRRKKREFRRRSRNSVLSRIFVREESCFDKNKLGEEKHHLRNKNDVPEITKLTCGRYSGCYNVNGRTVVIKLEKSLEEIYLGQKGEEVEEERIEGQ